MFLYARYADPVTGAVVRDFAQWALSPAGQNYAAQLGYLPLSDDVTELGNQALHKLDRIEISRDR
jgi:ABC-type phosphate transport system substrate-binding protein